MARAGRRPDHHEDRAWYVTTFSPFFEEDLPKIREMVREEILQDLDSR